MNKLTRLMAAVACAIPMVAGAQSSTPSTPSSLDTAPSPNIKPADPTTSGKNTGNDNANKTTTNQSSMSRSTAKTTGDKAKDAPPAGDVPTYPAPARDGTPTSPSTTK